MSSDLQWDPDKHSEQGSERLKPFVETLLTDPVVPEPSRLGDFAAVIENVIVPRLLMNRAEAEAALRRATDIKAHSVADFVRLATHENPEAAIQYVRNLLARGMPFQSILMDLMAPAARELGEQWIHDSTSFVEVTLGVARMHRILREFDGVPSHLWSSAGEGRHALILPAPGEHHTFGLRLVQEFLLRESWSVTNYQVESESQLVDVLKSGHFDVVGLSLSGETLLKPFLSAIRLIRSRARNPRIKIIVGGGYFAECPELAGECGADAYAPDAQSSVEIMNRWASELSAVN
jgi:MerR family transcriptional regulator, light-induced transcriptional regulator